MKKKMQNKMNINVGSFANDVEERVNKVMRK